MARPLDALPGFRRRFVVTPGEGWVRSEVEDDYHCMGVTVRHDGNVATSVEPIMWRAPWDTCPGAVAQLQQTFTNVPLDAFAGSADKFKNCTHLYDLAVLAAAHAEDAEPLVYDILVSDPIDEQRHAELRRNGKPVMAWTHENLRFVAPPELVGITLDKMRPWIDTLDARRQEEARVLRWGTMLAHGRTIPMDQQSDPKTMRQGSCYTFQPDVAQRAKRVGENHDFSAGGPQPLDWRKDQSEHRYH